MEIKMHDIEDELGAIWWKRWVGAYKDRLADGSKTHLVWGDEDFTLCGRRVPSEAEAEVEGASYANCKRCVKKIRGPITKPVVYAEALKRLQVQTKYRNQSASGV